MDTSLPLDELTAHVRGLARLAGDILGDRHGGEDVAQETLLRALRAERRPERSEEIRPWLRTIARRLALTERTARERRRRRESDAVAPSATPSTEEIAARAETARRLHAVVEGLAPQNRAVLLDRYVGGLTPTAIATRDGVALNTVNARLRRARVELRAALERGALGTEESWSMALAPLASLEVLAPSKTTGTVASALGLALGVSSMVKVLVPLAALLACLASFVLWSPNTLERASTTDAGRVAESAQVRGEPPVTETGVGERTPADASPIDPDVSTIRAPLRGRILDVNGAPLAGVEVSAALSLRVGGTGSSDLRSSARTGSGGDWQIDLPIGASVWGTLVFTPDRFRLSEDRSIGQLVGAADRDSWFEVQSSEPIDTTDVVLRAAGALAGRALDAGGRPLANASVRVHPRFDWDLERGPDFDATYGGALAAEGTTDEDGRFHLDRVFVGRPYLTLVLDGYVSRALEVDIAAREMTLVGDIALERAKVLAGTVVDADGEPIAGQRIEFEPKGGGHATRTRTDANGRFDVVLHAHGPHDAILSRNGYVGWGKGNSIGRPLFEAGSRDVEIVLERAPRTEFLVVDAITRDPLARYGVAVRRDFGSGAERRRFGNGTRARLLDHADGRCAVDARERIDMVSVWSPGYVDALVEVVHDTPGSGQQTIALERGAEVRGRVLLDGRPLPGASVVVTRGAEAFYSGYFEARTDAEGRYSLAGVFPGEQWIEVGAGPEVTTAELRIEVPVAGATEAVLDGVDFHLERREEGGIRGHVVLPRGVAAEGFTLEARTTGFSASTPIRGDGTFLLEGVPEGECDLSLQGGTGRLRGRPELTVTVPGGGTANVLFDASRFADGTLDLKVAIPGVDPTGVRVSLAHERDVPPGTPLPRTSFGLVVTEPLDTDGRATITDRASGAVYVELRIAGGSTVTLYDQPIELLPGETIEATVRYEPTSLTVEVPPAWLDEKSGMLWFSLWRDGHNGPLISAGLQREPMRHIQGAVIENGRARLPFVPAGRLRVQILGMRREGPLEGPKDVYVDIVPGEENALTLPPPVD